MRQKNIGSHVAGIDESGVGAIAGPVVAAAVAFGNAAGVGVAMLLRVADARFFCFDLAHESKASSSTPDCRALTPCAM